MKNLIIALAVLLLLTSCSKRDSRISNRIADQIRAGREELDLSDVAPFPWDRAFIFGPYTPESIIEQSIGHPWEEYRKTGIEYNEGFALLLFQSDGNVVAWCMNPRNNGDFAFLYSSKGYTRAEATFQVEYSGQDRRANITKRKTAEPESGHVRK